MQLSQKKSEHILKSVSYNRRLQGSKNLFLYSKIPVLSYLIIVLIFAFLQDFFQFLKLFFCQLCTSQQSRHWVHPIAPFFISASNGPSCRAHAGISLCFYLYRAKLIFINVCFVNLLMFVAFSMFPLSVTYIGVTLAAFAKYPRGRGCLAHCSRE